MARGYIMLLLHAHLPYVRHPEYRDFLEEDWFYEAMTETYLPLLMVFNGLIRDGIDFRITMSLTPSLTSMLADKLLQDRYEKHLNNLVELSNKELYRTKDSQSFHETALMYNKKFRSCHKLFVERYGKNLIQAFKELQDRGNLEIITCGATHGFMPLMSINPNAVNAQIGIACDSYKRFFLKEPNGIWNGECGYYPGLEEHLQRHGIRYFFVETHGLLYADKRPRYGVFAPMYCPNNVAYFGRDTESGQAVWSSKTGYPGDYNYREFYRDIGYDLDLEYIRPYIHENDLRIMTGIKYYKITGAGNEKEPYDHIKALEVAKGHASNFLYNRSNQIKHLSSLMDREPLVVAPYDAELFGHWWYEGPYFIDYFLRELSKDAEVAGITPSEYLTKYPKNQVSRPSFSSWGNKGYSEVWLNETNDWLYRHLHKCADLMVETVKNYKGQKITDLENRALKQMARELVLSQSSDWAFIMTAKTTVEYAVRRTRQHINTFLRLHNALINGKVNEEELSEIEGTDNIFPEIDYNHYSL